MSKTKEDTDSGRLKPRPFSEPNISEKSLGGGLRPELVDVWSQRCAFVVDEILQTEKDYVDSLHDVILGYRVPLVTRLKSSSDTQKLVNTLFGNIDDLHGLHMSLLKKLRAHDTEPHEFGQIFIQTESGFELYTAYCTNYNGAMLCLQQLLMSEKHNQFLDQCQLNLKHTLPLSAQLIKPVQRITRYHLLLHDLVKHFNPNHYGFPSVKQAHKAMARIADHINKVKKQEENARRVEHLQTSLYGWKGNEGPDNLSVYGELLLESTCHVGTKKGTERQVLLFEKLLLILKKKDAKRYNYKAHIVASELGLDATQHSANRTSFKIYSKTRHISYTIDPRSTSKRKEWVNAINDLIGRVEEEFGQFIKRKKLDEELSNVQQSPVPQRVETPVTILLDQSNTDLHGRLPSLRKRKRGDVRELFGQEEVNVRRAASDLTTYEVHQPAQTEVLTPIPVPVSEPTIEEEMEEEPPSPTQLEKRAESVESLLSLSDVEVGMEEHAGDFDEIEYPKRKIRRRRTDLKRRQAIKVKRSPSNHGLEASVRTRIRIKAREAKQDLNGDNLVTDKGESVSDGETELAKLMSPSQPMDSSIDQDSLFDSSMDSSTLGLSIGGGGAEGRVEDVAKGDTTAEVPDIDPKAQTEVSPSDGGVLLEQVKSAMDGGVARSLQDSGVHSEPTASLKKISAGPPIEIVPDYREGVSNTAKHREIEEDESFSMMIEDAETGASPVPEGALVMVDDEKGGDILIVEDSSSDSEDEEEDEGVGFSYSTECDSGTSLDNSIPAPAYFDGDQEVPRGEPDLEQHQVWDSASAEPEKSTEELSGFFKNLSRDTSPDLHVDEESADVSTTDQATTASEQPHQPQAVEPYLFTAGNQANVLTSPALDRIKELEIYATIPRKKARSKTGTPTAASPCMTPLVSRSSKKLQTSSSQALSRSAARRAEGFSELLQFTLQQQTEFTPLANMDVSQSLPSFKNGRVVQEKVSPLVYNFTESDVSNSRHESALSNLAGSYVPDNAIGAAESEEVSVTPEFAISPSLGETDEEEKEVEAESTHIVPLDGVSEQDKIFGDYNEPDSSQITKSAVNGLPKTVMSPISDEMKQARESVETEISPEAVISPPLDGSVEEELAMPIEVSSFAEHETNDQTTHTKPVVGVVANSFTPQLLTEVMGEDIPPKPAILPVLTGDSESIKATCSPEPAISPLLADSDKEEGSVEISSTIGGPEDVNVCDQSAQTAINGTSEFITPHLTDVIGNSDIADTSSCANPEIAICPPLKDSDEEDVDESTKPSGVTSMVDSLEEVEIRHDSKQCNYSKSHHATDPTINEISNSIMPQLQDEITNGSESGVAHTPAISQFAISPPLDDSDDDEHEMSCEISSSVEKTEESDDSKLHISSDLYQTKQTDIDEFSDKTELNGLQQKDDHNLRHRTCGQQEPRLMDSNSSLAGSRRERESSEESEINSDSHTMLSQPARPMATGLMGWLQRFLGRGLFGLVPPLRPLGVRSGLIAVSVAALSSVLLYILTSYGGSADGDATSSFPAASTGSV